MKVMGLDISTKTGVAILTDGVLTHYELVSIPFDDNLSQIDDLNLLERAKDMARALDKLVFQHGPDSIYIEQTNLGNNRRDQKLLEFIHCMTLEQLPQAERNKVVYVSSSQWRAGLTLKLSKEDRKHNKEVKANKEEGIRATAGKGKKTAKHLAVRWANEQYDLKLKVKDNDIADAICLATYGYLDGQKPEVTVNLSAIDSLF